MRRPLVFRQFRTPSWLQLLQVSKIIHVTILRLRTLFIVGVLNASFSSDGLTRSLLFKVGVVSDIFSSFILTGFFSKILLILQLLSLFKSWILDTFVFTRFFKIISWNWQLFTSYNLRGPVRLPLFWKKIALSTVRALYWQNQNKSWASEQ